MGFIGKWLGSLFVAVLLILALPSLQTNASTTTSTFYRDGVCKSCVTNVYVGPNGTVYQLRNDIQKVNALSSSGKKQWSYTFPKGTYLIAGILGKATADTKGNLYIGVDNSKGGYLASISSKGKRNWQFKVDKGGPSTPIVGKDQMVYFGTGNYTSFEGTFSESTYYAVTPTGKKKWSVKLKGDSYGESTLDQNQNIIIQTSNNDGDQWKYTISRTGKILSVQQPTAYERYDKAGNSYSLDYKSLLVTAKSKKGTLLWTYKVKDMSAGILYVTENGSVILREDGYTLSITNGKMNWKTKVEGNVISNRFGLYLFNNYSGKLQIYLLDMKYGKIKYSKKLNFKSYNYAVHPKGFILVAKERTLYKVSFFKEKSAPLKTSQIKLTNNADAIIKVVSN